MDAVGTSQITGPRKLLPLLLWEWVVQPQRVACGRDRWWRCRKLLHEPVRSLAKFNVAWPGQHSPWFKSRQVGHLVDGKMRKYLFFFLIGGATFDWMSGFRGWAVHHPKMPADGKLSALLPQPCSSPFSSMFYFALDSIIFWKQFRLSTSMSTINSCWHFSWLSS